jgi:hypothetical protein
MAITNTYIHADWDKIYHRDYFYIEAMFNKNYFVDYVPNPKFWLQRNQSFWLAPNVGWSPGKWPEAPGVTHNRSTRHFTHVRVEDAAEAQYKSGPINRMKAILDDINFNIMMGAADAYQGLRYFRTSTAYPLIRSGTATLKTRAAALKQTKQVLINTINTA